MRPLIRTLPALAVLALGACAGTGPAPSAGADASRTLATPLSDGHTAEGSFIDGFAFAEKSGDVVLGRVSVSGGVSRATGEIEPRRGSSWGGIGLTTGVSRGTRTVDVSGSRALVLALSANGIGTLRVRLVGPNAATRDSGCYPVTVVRVTPELRDYTLPLTAFAPEAFCGANAPGGVATAASLVAVEVADPVVAPGRKRLVDFSVGTIRVTN